MRMEVVIEVLVKNNHNLLFVFMIKPMMVLMNELLVLLFLRLR